jgi:hypothetical protein
MIIINNRPTSQDSNGNRSDDIAILDTLCAAGGVGTASGRRSFLIRGQVKEVVELIGVVGNKKSKRINLSLSLFGIEKSDKGQHAAKKYAQEEEASMSFHQVVPYLW